MKTKLEIEEHNLEIYKIEFTNHFKNETLSATEWDKKYNYLYDLIEETRADIKTLKMYKKLGKFYDLWA